MLGISTIALPSIAAAEEALPLRAADRERFLTILRDGLASDEFWPSMHAAEALTLAGQGAEVITALKPRLPKETHDQRRCGLARELVRAGDREALKVLVSILADRASIGRIHAAESLYKLGEEAPGGLLIEAAAQADIPQLQLMSAAALAKRGDRNALALLRKKLQSEDRLVRNTVCFALARLGTPEDVAPLRGRLELETDPLARANLINALASLGDPQGQKDLAESLRSTEPGIRASAAESAGYARCGEHASKLQKLLDDRVLDVRIRAAQSLIVLSRPAPAAAAERGAP